MRVVRCGEVCVCGIRAQSGTDVYNSPHVCTVDQVEIAVLRLESDEFMEEQLEGYETRINKLQEKMGTIATKMEESRNTTVPGSNFEKHVL